ncbi:MAG: Gfo/Idh/MocA family oxidoreductase, partial [Candidatus Sumerlaeota bacterium]|nr:Gfo/Idh/MocA family oxidoreductase [Candidatus Sumerlaeota bacterium]
VAAAPWIVPASARGAGGRPAPSRRVAMGCIGVGGQGTGDMRAFLGMPDVQVVAVCDVDREHRENAKKIVEERYAQDTASGSYKGCDAYSDFRELLARGDIDAVLIAPPDHWHAIPSIRAMESGKDVYCEKPLALTIAQGRAVADAARRTGRIFQVGSQQRSDEKFRFGCELVRNHRIGDLKAVRVGLGNGQRMEAARRLEQEANPPEAPVPDGFDYDLWLGPAPWAPYTKLRCHWYFRYSFDYSGGHTTDWGAHHLDIAQWGMGTERTGPVEVDGQGEFPRDGLFDTPLALHFECRYANGIPMIVDDRTGDGIRFEGTEGWVHVNRGVIEAEPSSLLTTIIGPNEIHLYDSKSHHRNFIDCALSRREPIAPPEIAHRSATIAHLGNIAMRLGRKLKWDPDTERFVNDPEADRMIGRTMRAPWTI